MRYPDRVKSYVLKKSYGITIEQYLDMFDAQGGLCKICRKPERARAGLGGSHARDLAVDHCHKTGRVRGLLCTRCNHAVGHYEEHPEVFNLIVKYLQEPS